MPAILFGGWSVGFAQSVAQSVCQSVRRCACFDCQQRTTASFYASEEFETGRKFLPQYSLFDSEQMTMMFFYIWTREKKELCLHLFFLFSKFSKTGSRKHKQQHHPFPHGMIQSEIVERHRSLRFAYVIHLSALGQPGRERE